MNHLLINLLLKRGKSLKRVQTHEKTSIESYAKQVVSKLNQEKMEKMLELACVQPPLYPKQHHKGILSQFFCVFVFSTCRDRLSTKALTLV